MFEWSSGWEMLDQYQHQQHDWIPALATSMESIAARLDPIEEDLIASIAVDKVRQEAPAFALGPLGLLLPDPQAPMWGLTRLTPATEAEAAARGISNRLRDDKGALRPRGPSVPQGAWPAVRELIQKGLFARTSTEVPHWDTIDWGESPAPLASDECRIFFVVKPGKIHEPTGLPLMRVIVDARSPNTLTTTNGTFQLFTLDALQQTISDVSHAADALGTFEWWCINVDLRHYFHQIPLREHLRPLFRIKCSDGAAASFVTPVAAPMGWYLTPLIAQNLTWSLLLGPMSCPLDCVAEYSELRESPAWLPLRARGTSGHWERAGGCFILTDNIFIISHQRKLVERVATRLQKNAQRWGFWFKNDSGRGGPSKTQTVAVQRITRQGGERISFVGVDIGYSDWRTVDKKRNSDILQQETPWTCRQLSRLLGEVLWDHRMRRISPLDCTLLADVYRPAGLGRLDWDAPSTIPDEHRAAVVAAVLEARQHRLCLRVPAWEPGGPRTTPPTQAGATLALRTCRSPARLPSSDSTARTSKEPPGRTAATRMRTSASQNSRASSGPSRTHDGGARASSSRSSSSRPTRWSRAAGPNDSGRRRPLRRGLCCADFASC
jgi:hypothetical protein